MVLTKIYQFVEAKLQAIEAIKFITWYNAQNAAILHIVPAALIEFPEPMNPQTLGEAKIQQAELIVRVALYSKLLTNNSGEINIEVMNTHELIALQIFEALQQQRFPYGSGNTAISSLNRTRFELDMNTPSMAITIQDFTCIATLDLT